MDSDDRMTFAKYKSKRPGKAMRGMRRVAVTTMGIVETSNAAVKTMFANDNSKHMPSSSEIGQAIKFLPPTQEVSQARIHRRMLSLSTFESIFTLKTSKCLPFQSVQRMSGVDSRAPFLIEAEGGIILPSVSIVKLTLEEVLSLHAEHWIKDLMERIMFECGISIDNSADSCVAGHVFLKVIHTSLEIDRCLT